MNKCSVDGCESISERKGYCSRHYWQVWRHGKVLDYTIFDKNEIIDVDDNTAGVVLKNVKGIVKGIALIDKEDVPLIENIKFGMQHGYAVAREKETNKWLPMQNIIKADELVDNKNKEIDHCDRNKLNNTKENLRLATRTENTHNRINTKENKTGYRNVYEDVRKKEKRFYAMVNHKGKKYFSSLMKTPEEAFEIAKELKNNLAKEFTPTELQ